MPGTAWPSRGLAIAALVLHVGRRPAGAAQPRARAYRPSPLRSVVPENVDVAEQLSRSVGQRACKAVRKGTSHKFPVGLAPARSAPANTPALYGERIERSEVLDLLRGSLKPSRLERIESRLAQRCSTVRICLENVADEHNAAACLRTFEGLGGQHVHVIESVDHLRPCRAITKSCDRWLTLHRHYDVDDCFAELKGAGFTVVSAHLSDDAVPLDEIDFRSMGKVCLVFGNERRGVSKLAEQHSDVCAVVPMSGFSQSFNISVAVALFLSHLRFEGKFVGDLPREELVALYKRWLILANKNPKPLLEKHGFGDEFAYL